jgi:hypothetical protein
MLGKGVALRETLFLISFWAELAEVVWLPAVDAASLGANGPPKAI